MSIILLDIQIRFEKLRPNFLMYDFIDIFVCLMQLADSIPLPHIPLVKTVAKALAPSNST